MKEYESFKRIGAEAHRSYYVPFSKSDKIRYVYGIIDRKSSSRFLSLDGEWEIKQFSGADNADINEELTATIPVPSCVQMHGYDNIQYINIRYPFPVRPPYVPKDTPCWHYRKKFSLSKKAGEKYYLLFEGVDSAYYLYVNGKFKGYSQISHATGEFDVTDLTINGENTLDVIVLKWCASSYFECQDKFRFSGIFRSEDGCVRNLCAHYEMQGGASVLFEISGRSKFFGFEIILVGTEGRITIGNGIAGFEKRRPSKLYSGFYSLMPERVKFPRKTGYFSNMIQNAVDFLDGNAPLMSTLQTGLDALKVLEDIKSRL